VTVAQVRGARRKLDQRYGLKNLSVQSLDKVVEEERRKQALHAARTARRNKT